MYKLKLMSLLLLASLTVFSFEPIKPSKAKLQSNVGDMEVEMRLREDGTWKLTSTLDGGSIVRREESEVFELIDNQIKPINYRFNQRILFRRYKASADFDWNNKKLSFVENKDKGVLELYQNILGPSSASLQLRLDFRKLKEGNIPDEISYDVYWKGTIKKRSYDVSKVKESVETPLGMFEAYKVSRQFDEANERSQIFWLAPSLDFSVIKIYDKNDREIEIEIKEFEEIN
tara:strand:- start:114 stop:806 length:693 start_codon:yes stop_codon:yes gene_type:complete